MKGLGLIDGQGWAFARTGYPGRPRVVQFVSCRNVRVEGVRTVNSSAWTQHDIDCEEIALVDVTVCSTECDRNKTGSI